MILFSKSTGGGAAVRAALDPRAESTAIDESVFSIPIPTHVAEDLLPTPPLRPAREQELQWTKLVNQVQANDPRGLEDLYAYFSKGARFYFCRHLGLEQLDDRVHDTFLIVVDRIKRGELRDPERLMGFIRTILRRQVAAYVRGAVEERRDYAPLDAESEYCLDFRGCPEERIIDLETVDIMERVMRGMNLREREILTRFYLLEQAPEHICKEMRINLTQFRLMKSRAKGRFGELGRRSLLRQSLESLNVNTSA
jgi:RNA polymerase sigma-70 factor (ECF subfamily)